MLLVVRIWILDFDLTIMGTKRMGPHFLRIQLIYFHWTIFYGEKHGTPNYILVNDIVYWSNIKLTYTLKWHRTKDAESISLNPGTCRVLTLNMCTELSLCKYHLHRFVNIKILLDFFLLLYFNHLKARIQKHPSRNKYE